MLQYRITIINRKKTCFFGTFDIASLVILPTVFSSSIVPDYQAPKTLVKPNMDDMDDMDRVFTAI